MPGNTLREGGEAYTMSDVDTLQRRIFAGWDKAHEASREVAKATEALKSIFEKQVGRVIVAEGHSHASYDPATAEIRSHAWEGAPTSVPIPMQKLRLEKVADAGLIVRLMQSPQRKWEIMHFADVHLRPDEPPTPEI